MTAGSVDIGGIAFLGRYQDLKQIRPVGQLRMRQLRFDESLTDGRMDRRTDGRTHPHIEMRGRI